MSSSPRRFGPVAPGRPLANRSLSCEKCERPSARADGGLSAHFEHSIAFTKEGVRVLTLLNGEEEA